MKEITDTAALDAALAHSEEGPVALFKHSTICPISAAAHREVGRYIEQAGADAVPVYLIRVREARAVSDAVADRLNVGHASPQLILVKCKEAYHDASHGAIRADAIEEAVSAASP